MMKRPKTETLANWLLEADKDELAAALAKIQQENTKRRHERQSQQLKQTRVDAPESFWDDFDAAKHALCAFSTAYEGLLETEGELPSWSIIWRAGNYYLLLDDLKRAYECYQQLWRHVFTVIPESDLGRRTEMILRKYREALKEIGDNPEQAEVIAKSALEWRPLDPSDNS